MAKFSHPDWRWTGEVRVVERSAYGLGTSNLKGNHIVERRGGRLLVAWHPVSGHLSAGAANRTMAKILKEVS